MNAPTFSKKSLQVKKNSPQPSVSEKIATLKSLPHMDTWPACWPNTDHYIDITFSCQSKIILVMQLLFFSLSLSTQQTHGVHLLNSLDRLGDEAGIETEERVVEERGDVSRNIITLLQTGLQLLRETCHIWQLVVVWDLKVSNKSWFCILSWWKLF